MSALPHRHGPHPSAPFTAAPTVLVTTALAKWAQHRATLRHASAEIGKSARTVQRLAEFAGCTSVAQLHIGVARDWLALRAVTPKTYNNEVDRLRGFSRFVRAQDFRLDDVFGHLESITGDVTGEGVRTADTFEVCALVGPARALPLDPSRSDRTRAARAQVYLLAAYTGLRFSELKRLQWGHVALQADVPHVQLPGLLNKTRRRQPVALHPEALCMLWALRDGSTSPSARVFAAMPGTHTIYQDLARAGIARRDSLGAPIAFHSLRKWLAKELDRAHVRSKTIATILRHSGEGITARRYQRSALREQYSALMQLPALLFVTLSVTQHEESLRSIRTDADQCGQVGAP